MTVFATVDLGTGRVVNVEAAQHLRTPLSDEEYEEAKALARERSEQVKALYQKFGEQALASIPSSASSPSRTTREFIA